MKDTIEEKIDKLRMEREENQGEEMVSEKHSNAVNRAGGIDGGFSHDELQEMLH